MHIIYVIDFNDEWLNINFIYMMEIDYVYALLIFCELDEVCREKSINIIIYY